MVHRQKRAEEIDELDVPDFLESPAVSRNIQRPVEAERAIQLYRILERIKGGFIGCGLDAIRSYVPEIWEH